MTIGCVQFSSVPYFHKRCCSRIVDTTRTGSGSLPASKEHGRIFNPNEIEDPICFSPYLYRARNLVERFFNKIKQCRRVATRHDKLAANYLAFVKLASIRIWLRAIESAPWLPLAGPGSHFLMADRTDSEPRNAS
jgi:transposase